MSMQQRSGESGILRLSNTTAGQGLTRGREHGPSTGDAEGDCAAPPARRPLQVPMRESVGDAMPGVRGRAHQRSEAGREFATGRISPPDRAVVPDSMASEGDATALCRRRLCRLWKRASKARPPGKSWPSIPCPAHFDYTWKSIAWQHSYRSCLTSNGPRSLVACPLRL
jgi:hypothetical protein